MQQIREDQPDHRDLARFIRKLCAEHEGAEAEACLDDAEAELDRCRRLEVLLREPDPESGERQREEHDEAGVERAELRSRKRYVSGGSVDNAIGEQRHRSGGLLEQRPEHDGCQNQEHEHHGTAELVRVMRHEAIDDERDDQGDSEIKAVFGDRSARRQEGRHVAEVGQHGIDTGEYGHRREHVGDPVVLVHPRVNHRIKNDAHDGDDQEHVLREQDNGFVLHEEPEHAQHRQAQQVDRPFTTDRAEDLFLQLLRLGRFGMAVQELLPVRERNQADDHADAGRAEAVLPAEGFTEPAAQQRGDERADVDAHVENRKARITTRVVLGIQLADDRRDIGLQVPDAHHDQREGQVEHIECRRVTEHDRLGQDRTGNEDLAAGKGKVFNQRHPGRVVDRLVTLHGHQDVAQRQQYAAEQNRLAHAEKAVCNQSADDGQRIDETGVRAENIEAHLVAKQVVLGQVQEQQVFHSIE